MIDNLLKDVRYAARILSRNPGFTAVAVTVLALGIGVTSAMFSFVDAVLLKPLAYKDPERLVAVWEKTPRVDRSTPAPPTFFEWRARNQVFSHMAAYTTFVHGGDSAGFTLTGQGAAERVRATAVSANYFEMLGIPPALGRSFRAEEEQYGKEHVAILSDRFWRRKFNVDPAALGRAIQLGNEKYTVVGVLPRNSIFDRLPTDVWLPLAVRPDQMRLDTQFFFVLARMKPGVTLEQADAEMKRITEALAREGPGWRRDYTANVLPFRDHVVERGLRDILLLLFGAVVFILLIACVNIANLLVARGAYRQREVAVRAALGAARLRLVRQFLTESLMLAALGGCLGLLVARWLIDAFTVLMPEATLPREAVVSLDWRIVAFTLCASILAGVAFGIGPAWRASRQSLALQMRPGRSRFRDVLVAAEVALTFMLVIGSALLIRSFARLLAVDPGFRTEGVLTASTQLWKGRYPQGRQVLAYQDELLRRLQAIPGVRSAAVTNALPLTGRSSNTNAFRKGRWDTRTDVGVRPVNPDYFATLGIRLLRGRLVSERDTANTPPVLVINQSLARRFWPDSDAIGGQFRFTGGALGPQPHTVVGVIADVKHSGLASDIPYEAYVPIAQVPEKSMDFFARTLKFAIRTAVPPASVIPAVQRAAASVDKDQPLFEIQTMGQIYSESVAQPRFRTLLFGIFGALALVLAAVGIYGVLYYSVAQRTQEIGIRMALGANVGDVLQMVLRQGLALAACGIIAGACGALAAARLLSAYLFGVRPTDALTFAGVSVVMLAVALLACWLPARRAAKVDPMVALRYE